MAETPERDKKVLTIFSFYPYTQIAVGTPQCLKELTS